MSHYYSLLNKWCSEIKAFKNNVVLEWGCLKIPKSRIRIDLLSEVTKANHSVREFECYEMTKIKCLEYITCEITKAVSELSPRKRTKYNN